MPPIKFQSIGLTVREEMLSEEFQDVCSQPGYRNGTILVILNLCATVMPPIKFWLIPTYGLGGDVVPRISRWPPWQPSWLLEGNDFSNFESLCHCDASHQFFAQSDLRFGRRCLEEFQDGHHSGHLGNQNRMILAILNLCVTVMPHIKF